VESVPEVLARLNGRASFAQLTRVASKRQIAAAVRTGAVQRLARGIYGLPDKPHITVPVKRRPRSGPPAVLHWAAIASEDRARRLTSLLRTVLDCTRILPFGEALAVADAGLSRGLTKQELLLRFTYQQVLFEQDWVVARIREALGHR
jgi:hypothetical protein